MCKAMFVMAVLFGVGVLGERTDEEVVNTAKKAIDQYCVEDKNTDAEELETGKARMKDVIGEKNFLLEAARKSEDKSQFQTNMQDEISNEIAIHAWMLLAASIAFLLLIIFTYCWCCSRCRPCKRFRSILAVFVSGCLLICILFALVAAVATTLRGASISNKGFDNLNCVTATLLYQSLEGDGQSFLGFTDALAALDNMTTSLANDSALVNKIKELTEKTENMSDAVVLANESLQNASQDFTPQQCPCVEQLQEQFDQAPGPAFEELRKELDSALGPAKRASLTKILDSAHAAINLLKDMLIKAVGPIVKADTNAFEPFDMVPNLILIVFCCGVVPVFLGALGIALTLLCGRGRCAGKGCVRTPHRCTCCSWYLAMYLTMICFVLAFAMVGVSSILAPVCEIMDDLDGAMLKEIGPAFGIDGSKNPDLVVAVDKCINPKDPGLDFNLLDLPSANDVDIPGSASGDGILDSIEKSFVQGFDKKIGALDNSTPPTPLTSLANVQENTQNPCLKACKGIETKLTFMQTTAESLGDDLDDMKGLVKSFTDPLIRIMQNIRCGWLGVIWQRLIDSLCYQGIYGLLRIGQGYIVSAFAYLLLGLVAFFVWCVMMNNVQGEEASWDNVA